MPAIHRGPASIDPQLEARLSVAAVAPAVVTAWTRAELDRVEALGVRGTRLRALPMIVAPRLTGAQLASLRRSPAVRSVFGNRSYKLDMADTTWITGAHETWRSPDLGGLGITGDGVEVAVIDTGINGKHQDTDNLIEYCEVSGAADRLAVACSPFNPDSGNAGPAGASNDARADSADDGGHGSHVSGTIAGTGDASGGIGAPHSTIGMAPRAKLHVYSSGAGLSVSLIGAVTAYDDMIYKKQRGLGNVVAVNNSWGDDAANANTVYDPNSSVEVAVQEAYHAGIVTVFSAGNSGPGFDSLSSNCVSPWVICVAASTKTDQIADFSSRGLPAEPADTDRDGYIADAQDEVPHNQDRALGQALGIGVYRPTLTAPGVDIRSINANSADCREGDGPDPGDCYWLMSGTSMAAPHVVGAVALVVQAYRMGPSGGASPSAGEIIDILERSSNIAKLPAYEAEEQGVGRLDVAAAVRFARDYASNPFALNLASLGYPTPAYSARPGQEQTIVNEPGCTSPSSAVVERDPSTGEPRFGQHVIDVPSGVERLHVTWDWPSLDDTSLAVSGAIMRMWEPGVDPDGSGREPGPSRTFAASGGELDLRAPRAGAWTLRFYTAGEAGARPCNPNSKENPKQSTGFNYVLVAVATTVASAAPAAAIISPLEGSRHAAGAIAVDGTASYPASWDGVTNWEVAGTALPGGGGGGGSATPTTLYFDGNTEDGCTGDGATDVLRCGGPFLRPAAERTLSAETAASWKVADPAFDGSGAHNVYDPNWIWQLGATTRLQGPMTVSWWAGCPGCNVDALWTIRLWADGVKKFERDVTATTALPSVPERLTATVTLPFVQAASAYVLHVDPGYIDAQANTSIYYDSSQPCPGAQGTEACDSSAVMPVTDSGPAPAGPATPTEVRVTDVHNGLRVAWDPVPGAVSYEIHQTFHPDFRPEWTRVTTVPGESCMSPDVPTWPGASRSGLCYTDPSGSVGDYNTSYYRIAAVGSLGNKSGLSAVASGMVTPYDRRVRVVADRPYGQGVAEFVAPPGDGTAWTATWDAAGISVGAHRLLARAFTQGLGSSEPLVRVIVGATAPSSPIITAPLEGAVLTNGSVTVAGTAEQSATVSVIEAGSGIGVGTAGEDGRWTAALHFAPGPHTITATATDAAGYTSTASPPRSFRIEPGSTGIHPIATGLLPAMGSVITGTDTVQVSWTAATGGEPVVAYVLVVARPGEFSRVWFERVDPTACTGGACGATLAFPLTIPGGKLEAGDKYATGIFTVFADGHRSDGACDDESAFGKPCPNEVSHAPGYAHTEYLLSAHPWERAYQSSRTRDTLLLDSATGEFQFVRWNEDRIARIFAGTGSILHTPAGSLLLFAGNGFALAAQLSGDAAQGFLLTTSAFPGVIGFEGIRR
ncbi:MAG: S8 family serine peptidase [Acidobacteria bacterium]|nr:S8 family serine peptidase [Acidobacteriota bacterium]